MRETNLLSNGKYGRRAAEDSTDQTDFYKPNRFILVQTYRQGKINISLSAFEVKFLSVNVICHILPQYLSTCSAGDSFEEEPGTGERFQIVGTVSSKDEKRRRFALEEYSVSFHRKKGCSEDMAWLSNTVVCKKFGHPCPNYT